MITFLNNYFFYCNIAFLHKKSKAIKVIWSNTTFHSVKKLHTDNKREYIMLELKSFLREQRIIYKTSTPHVCQQNSCVEQLDYTLLEKT